MKFAVRSKFCLVAALVLAMSVAAEAQNAKAEKQGKKAKAKPTPAAFKLPAEITLSAEQQAKLDELKTQYADKLTDAQKKVNDVFTAEQKAARLAARKDAVAAGKKGKELNAAVDAAVQLSDEQKTQLADAQKAARKLQAEVRKQVVALLTDEQKQLLPGKKKKA
ncbi:MAG TPA: hypothetical protein VMV10_20260 [Pirellulales bacterium]|nr:hypothetical protein [Pirellulales bacterium]